MEIITLGKIKSVVCVMEKLYASFEEEIDFYI